MRFCPGQPINVVQSYPVLIACKVFSLIAIANISACLSLTWNSEAVLEIGPIPDEVVGRVAMLAPGLDHSPAIPVTGGSHGLAKEGKRVDAGPVVG